MSLISEAESHESLRRLLVDGENQSVWIQTLSPGEETPWHWHESVTDNFIATQGEVVVDTHDHRGSSKLVVGCWCAVVPKTQHRVRNIGQQSATVVTVQTGGRRDFNLADDASAR